jgi:hypothetical protein
MSFKKIINHNIKYIFSNELINYLDIISKPYSVAEIKKIILEKMFKGLKTKTLTWEDGQIFPIDSSENGWNIVSYHFIIKYVLNNLIECEYNAPNCNYYGYFQEPNEVSTKEFKKLLMVKKDCAQMLLGISK